MKNCLAIAGSDCSGGAGIQADLKAFSAMGTFGMSVVTSVVAENTSRVISIQDIDCGIIADQIDAVFEDIQVDGVKIGMLSNADIMKTVAEKLKEYKPRFAVIDPVMVATSGGALLKSDSLDALVNEIIPLSFVLTPNIPEAEVLSGMKIETVGDMQKAAVRIHDLGADNVLVKGGHLTEEATDILYDGENFHSFSHERIASRNTHGTGCTLSSAITARLARGDDIITAVHTAKIYLTEAIRNSFSVGKGNGPVNHFYEYYNMKGL
ncbi:bifunctional hydroxymethylpyrimidine kinase/phosphomethylpyrimidine kinase [Ruminococcus sp. Marseille-P6503]|uniref:bifunctional hydroxymethylpyrimidine kinase/phosphomethylpyrimidine kinase n=1 Tax=Ruminococcus sp. Marseille-P6503 TaxID=2364796 RepID=UPI000F530DF9|nr:bifunctional hydroxymethylpyrimidine kinase/phosphomethylpyrimidine kinase [Ruminococcus sp. Marseille-P6503]